MDERYPEAERIVLVCDNLKTYTPAPLYEAFPPAEAKYSSWLNMAEIELSVLSRQCPDRRVPDVETLQEEVQAWQQRSNAEDGKIDCRFTTEDARIKLNGLYPSLEEYRCTTLFATLSQLGNNVDPTLAW